MGAYRRHLPRCKRNILVKGGIRDLVLLSDICRDECSRGFSNNVVMGDVAPRKLESMIRV
jgi:hypothetical protein